MSTTNLRIGVNPVVASGDDPHEVQIAVSPAIDSAGKAAQLRVDGNGSLVTGGGKTLKSVAGSASSNTAVIAAVASKRIKVVAFECYTAYSAGAIVPILTDGNGGTTLWNRLLQAISGAISGAVAAVGAPSFLLGTAAGNALYLNPNGQTVYYNITYFADDAT